jgi:hypothetical protein
MRASLNLVLNSPWLLEFDSPHINSFSSGVSLLFLHFSFFHFLFLFLFLSLMTSRCFCPDWSIIHGPHMDSTLVVSVVQPKLHPYWQKERLGGWNALVKGTGGGEIAPSLMCHFSMLTILVFDKAQQLCFFFPRKKKAQLVCVEGWVLAIIRVTSFILLVEQRWW